jgi:tetratricopeptide (TPR) repeat protein/predicted Ser/Thr protein kinase
MHPEVAVLKFLDAVDADLESAGLRDVDAYVRDFPEHAERIRAEYERLVATHRTPEPGPPRRRIGGRYQVIQSLGRGGFGEVFLAEDTRLARRVAIKVLAGLHALSEEWRARLVREAEATNRIADEGLCPVFDVGFDEGIPFLVMPWIQGRSLDRLIAASAARGEGPVQLGATDGFRARRDAFLALVESIARTLQVVHEAGVVHRDIKPANILVRDDGRPVLIDFGLAWLEAGDDALSRSGGLGTPAYSAPEVLHGVRVAPDPRLDVWSLGIVLFEGLTLRRPFNAHPGRSLERSVLDGPTPRLDAGLGSDLQAVVETALALQPERRYPSMSAFAEDLRRLRAGEPVGVRPAGALRRLVSWARSRPRLVGFGTAGLAVALAALVLGTWRWTRERELTVVARAVTSLAASMDQLVLDTDQLARFGFGVEQRAAEAERLLGTVRELRAGVGPSADVDRSLARVLAAAGALHLQLGSLERGAERVREALSIRERLRDRGLAGDEDRAALAHCLVLLGDARGKQDDISGALDCYRAAQRIDELRLAEQPGDATRVSNVGFGHLRIGDMEARNRRWDEALDRLREAIVVLRRAEAIEPDRQERRTHTADAMLALATAMRRLGAPRDDRLALVDDLEARLHDEVERFPRNSQAWLRLQSAKLLRSDLAEDAGQRLALATEAIECATRGVQLEPGVPLRLGGLATALRAQASALADLGRLDEAVAAAEQALAAVERAAADESRTYLLIDERIAMSTTVAALSRRRGDSARADEVGREALALAEACWRASRHGTVRLAPLCQVLLDPALVGQPDPGRVIALIDGERAAGREIGARLRGLEERARLLRR